MYKLLLHSREIILFSKSFRCNLIWIVNIQILIQHSQMVSFDRWSVCVIPDSKRKIPGYWNLSLGIPHLESFSCWLIWKYDYRIPIGLHKAMKPAMN